MCNITGKIQQNILDSFGVCVNAYEKSWRIASAGKEITLDDGAIEQLKTTYKNVFGKPLHTELEDGRKITQGSFCNLMEFEVAGASSGIKLMEELSIAGRILDNMEVSMDSRELMNLCKMAGWLLITFKLLFGDLLGDE